MTSRTPGSAGLSPAGAFAGLIFIVLGVLFFLDAVDLVDLRLDVLLPVAVIALGLAVILAAVWPRGRRSS